MDKATIESGGAAKEKSTARKSTETTRRVRGIVRNMYIRAHLAKANGDPVAYCMSASQMEEILDAMGIAAIWTENYAGLCAAKRDAERFLLKAEAEGYANEVCGYVRTGLGFDAMRKEAAGMPENAPDGGMVEPDIMIGSSAVCDPRYKWYQSSGRYLDSAIYNYDLAAPPVDADLDAVRDYYIDYAEAEFRGLIAFLEEQTKRKMDYDLLWERLRISDETCRLWWEVDELRKAIPGPMPSGDHFTAMVPGFYQPSQEESRDFYRDLKAEIQQRVDEGRGVIENERYRLLWGGGLPPWHTMWMFNYFEDAGAVFVIERGYRGMDPHDHEIPSSIKDPIKYLAYRTFLRATQRYESAKKNSGNPVVEHLLELIKDYRIDGVVNHAPRSCRATAIGQIFMKNMMDKYIQGMPALFLQSDIIDLRDYSEAQWKMQIDSFLETVASAARSRGK